MSFDCRKCNVCSDILGEQDEDRIHFIDTNPDSIIVPPVLVLDDCYSSVLLSTAMECAAVLLGVGVDFTYTRTVRCEATVGWEAIDKAVQRCSVWTRQLLDNRSLILATKTGLIQMGVGLDRRPGDYFRSKQYGAAVLCIPPLVLMVPEEYKSYKTKTKMLLKNMGVLV